MLYFIGLYTFFCELVAIRNCDISIL